MQRTHTLTTGQGAAPCGQLGIIVIDDTTEKSGSTAAPSSANDGATQRVESPVTNTPTQPAATQIRDPAAYYGAKLEAMERLLTKQTAEREQERATFKAGLRESALNSVLAKVQSEDERVQRLARVLAEQGVSVDDKTLKVTIDDSLISDLAALTTTSPAEPAAPTGVVSNAPRTQVVTPPPTPDLAAPPSADWQSRLNDGLADLFSGE